MVHHNIIKEKMIIMRNMNLNSMEAVTTIQRRVAEMKVPRAATNLRGTLREKTSQLPLQEAKSNNRFKSKSPQLSKRHQTIFSMDSTICENDD